MYLYRLQQNYIPEFNLNGHKIHLRLNSVLAPYTKYINIYRTIVLHNNGDKLGSVYISVYMA